MSGRVFGYTFGRVPTWLLDAAVSDRAVRLFAVLTRYADREGRGFPGRRALAGRLRCSVDSLDRALRELVAAGAVRVEERWDLTGDGGRLTNDYFLLEQRDEDPGRRGAAPPRRTGVASPGRADAAPAAAPMRPLREREPEEREPGETPPSLPPSRRGRRGLSETITRSRSRGAADARARTDGDAVGEVNTQVAALLPRLGGHLQPAQSPSDETAPGRRRGAPAVNPVDARILASIRRSEEGE